VNATSTSNVVLLTGLLRKTSGTLREDDFAAAEEEKRVSFRAKGKERGETETHVSGRKKKTRIQETPDMIICSQ
jgi:hypothetical protein